MVLIKRKLKKVFLEINLIVEVLYMIYLLRKEEIKEKKVLVIYALMNILNLLLMKIILLEILKMEIMLKIIVLVIIIFTVILLIIVILILVVIIIIIMLVVLVIGMKQEKKQKIKSGKIVLKIFLKKLIKSKKRKKLIIKSIIFLKENLLKFLYLQIHLR